MDQEFLELCHFCGNPNQELQIQNTHFSEETLLPLTPPPFYTIYNYSKYKPTKKNSRSKLLHTLFSKIKLKKTELNSSLSSTSLSSSSPVVPSVHFLYSCKLEDEYEQVIDVASSTSTLCAMDLVKLVGSKVVTDFHEWIMKIYRETCFLSLCQTING